MDELSMFKKLYTLWAGIKECNSGVTAIYFGLAIPVFLGFAGLAFDGSIWLMERRVLQSTVDASTMTAAYSYVNDGSSTDMTTAATIMAAENNFVVGGANTLVVYNPPIIGDFTTEPDAVQVITTMPADGFFSAAFGADAMTITTMATAMPVLIGQACMLSLHESEPQALTFQGNNTTTMNCGAHSNSTDDQSIYVNGSPDITVNPALSADGDVDFRNGEIDGQTLSNQGHVDDPYADLEVPTIYQNCTPGIGVQFVSSGPDAVRTLADAAAISGNTHVSESGGVYTLEPGRYCDGFPIDGENVVLSPGTYILDAADFAINGGSLSGVGVTIILTGTYPAPVTDMGEFKITGGTVDLVAPYPGDLSAAEQDFAGVLFYQDRNAPYPTTGSDNLIAGNANINISGAVYLPTQPLDVRGTLGTNGGACIQLLASTLSFSGNDAIVIENDTTTCNNLGVEQPELEYVLLVE